MVKLPITAVTNRQTSLNRRDAIKKYSDPFANMDAESVRRLRNQCIRIALTYTIAGTALVSVLIWANGAGQNRHDRVGGGLSGAGVMIFALFFYGIFRLCTIKRSMLQKQRSKIIINHIEK